MLQFFLVYYLWPKFSSPIIETRNVYIYIYRGEWQGTYPTKEISEEGGGQELLSRGIKRGEILRLPGELNRMQNLK